MSAPLRKMGSQFRRLDTKFISARNFSSNTNTVSDAPPGIYEKCAAVAICGTLGLSIALFAQKQVYGRVFNILGFRVGYGKAF